MYVIINRSIARGNALFLNLQTMKKLTQEEADAIKVLPPGKKTLLRVTLLSMGVGEIVLIEPHEWTWKRQPLSTYCRRLEKLNKRRFDCKKAVDGTGWVVKRVG